MNQHSSLSEAIYKLLPDFSPQGYPLEIFCTKQIVESLTCAICLGVYRDPVTSTTCGHSFCKQCFADLKAKGGFSTACPDCRKVITSAVDTFAIKSSILNQQVKCPLNVIKKLPCEWEGKLDQLESHMEHDCKQIPRPKLKGYPPAIFVNLATKDTLNCHLCKGIFREPVIVECGHTFCRNCIAEYDESNSANNETGKKLCPDCFHEYAGFSPLLQMQRMITSEQVVCTAEVQKKQCVWKGSIEDWEIHRRSCKGVIKDIILFEQEGKTSSSVSESRINTEQIMPEITVSEDYAVQLPASRHCILRFFQRCCALVAEAIKFVLLILLKILFAMLMFAIFFLKMGCFLLIKEPAIIATFILMSNSTSGGWILFFGVVTPMTLLIFYDIFRWFNFTNMPNINNIRAMDLLSMKYICYICTICNDSVFTHATLQEKERMANLWHHLYWWLMKSGIHIMTLVWTALIDESDTVRNFGTLVLTCRIEVGINLGIDVLIYFFTVIRIRQLQRQYHL